MLFRFFLEREGVRSVLRATCREEILDEFGPRDLVTACFRLPAVLEHQTEQFVLDHYARRSFPAYTDMAPDLSLRETVRERVARVTDRIGLRLP